RDDTLRWGKPEGEGSPIVRFGVVTPTLNAERFLEQTLRSVWAQQGPGIEIDHVIVDGGSTDRTLEIVEGEVLGYINADDEIAPRALRLVAAVLEQHPDVGWVCGRVEYIDAEGQVLGRMTPVDLTLRSYLGLGWSCIPQQTVWARRAFFERVGPFDISYRNCGDYDWYA